MEVSHDLAQEHRSRPSRFSRSPAPCSAQARLGRPSRRIPSLRVLGKAEVQAVPIRLPATPLIRLPLRRLARMPPRKEARQERVPARRPRQRLSLRRRQKSPPSAKSRQLPPSLMRLKAEEAKAESSAAAEKVKAGDIPVPADQWPRRHLRRSSKTA